MIENDVNNTILPQENKYREEIKELQHKNELLIEKNKHLEELNKQLKENLNDLRNKIKNK